MNSRKLFTNATLLSALLFALIVSPASAAVRCETQYGGAQTCVKTGELQINKQVWDPQSSAWRDNLDLSQSKRFLPGEDIKFRLEVKNVGDATFGKVTLTDTLPNFLYKASGETSWEITNLDPGKTESREFIARFVPANQLPDDINCVVNTAEVRGDRDNAYDKDKSTVCYTKQKTAAAVKQLPKAGPEDLYLFFGLSTLAGLSGFYLTHKVRI